MILIYCGFGNAEMFYFYNVSFVLWLLGLGLYLEEVFPHPQYFIFLTHLFSFGIFKFSFYVWISNPFGICLVLGGGRDPISFGGMATLFAPLLG